MAHPLAYTPLPDLSSPTAALSHSAPSPSLSHTNTANDNVGFVSEKFPSPPVTLTLKLKSHAVIKQFRLLSHAHMIASKIEISVGGSPNKFRRLGFVSLDDNSRSGYKARELKNVTVDCEGRYVRLVMHKARDNRVNLFNQVGLVGLEVVGVYSGEEAASSSSSSSSSPPSEGSESDTRIEGNNNNNSNNNYSDATDDVYNNSSLPNSKSTQNSPINDEMWLCVTATQNAKDSAVRSQDYASAKALKSAESTLRSSASRVARLEDAKNGAVLEEDYDRAGVLQGEIEKLREGAEKIMGDMGIVLPPREPTPPPTPLPTPPRPEVNTPPELQTPAAARVPADASAERDLGDLLAEVEGEVMRGEDTSLVAKAIPPPPRSPRLKKVMQQIKNANSVTRAFKTTVKDAKEVEALREGLDPKWSVDRDEATGYAYYYNEETGESSWERPPDENENVEASVEASVEVVVEGEKFLEEIKSPTKKKSGGAEEAAEASASEEPPPKVLESLLVQNYVDSQTADGISPRVVDPPPPKEETVEDVVIEEEEPRDLEAEAREEERLKMEAAMEEKRRALDEEEKERKKEMEAERAAFEEEKKALEEEREKIAMERHDVEMREIEIESKASAVKLSEKAANRKRTESERDADRAEYARLSQKRVEAEKREKERREKIESEKREEEERNRVRTPIMLWDEEELRGNTPEDAPEAAPTPKPTPSKEVVGEALAPAPASPTPVYDEEPPRNLTPPDRTADASTRPRSPESLESSITDGTVLAAARGAAELLGKTEVEHVHSKDWNFRVQGYEMVREKLSSFSTSVDEKTIKVLFEGVLKFGGNDSVAEVFLSSVTVVEELSKIVPPNNSLDKTAFNNISQNYVRSMIERLGDDSAEVNKRALDAILAIADMGTIPYVSQIALRRMHKWEETNPILFANRIKLLNSLLSNAIKAHDEHPIKQPMNDGIRILATSALRFAYDSAAFNSDDKEVKLQADELQMIALEVMGSEASDLIAQQNGSSAYAELLRAEKKRHEELESLVKEAGEKVEDLTLLDAQMSSSSSDVKSCCDEVEKEIVGVFEKLEAALLTRKGELLGVLGGIREGKEGVLKGQKDAINDLKTKLMDTCKMATDALGTVQKEEYNALVEPVMEHLKGLTRTHGGIKREAGVDAEVKWVSGGKPDVVERILNTFGAIHTSSDAVEEIVEGPGGEEERIHLTVRSMLPKNNVSLDSASSSDAVGVSTPQDTIVVEVRSGTEWDARKDGGDGAVLGRVIVVNSVERPPRDAFTTAQFFESFYTHTGDEDTVTVRHSDSGVPTTRFTKVLKFNGESKMAKELRERAEKAKVFDPIEALGDN